MTTDPFWTWEFTQGQGWKRIACPIEPPNDIDDMSDWLKRQGYKSQHELTDDFDAFGLVVYTHQSDNWQGAYNYVVFLNTVDGDSFETIFVPALPDLLALGREVYPLFRMAQTTQQQNWLEDILSKFFQVYHGHDLTNFCRQCDPVAHERFQKRRQRQRVASGDSPC